MLNPECKIESSANCNYIIGKDNRVWMQISSKENNVILKLFQRNIPAEFIGENDVKELTYTLTCKTPEAAFRCKSFFTDFIDRGYGEKWCRGEGWLIALDLQDITEVLSKEMRYHEFECDSNNISNVASNFFKEIGFIDTQNVLVCVYIAHREENISSVYDEIIEALHEASHGNCVVVQQCVMDKIMETKTTVKMLYG